MAEGDHPTRRFGHLEVVATLGRGARGKVYETCDPSTGARFVVKRLQPKKASSGLGTARFVREAQVMASLRHPNIMPVLHAEVLHDPRFYVMPFRQGLPLDVKLARSVRLAPSTVAEIARDVSHGLAEAHRRGVVHRDVKPANVFVEAAGRAVLIDFGLAKVPEPDVALTRIGFTLGTPAYMSPEQCRGEVVGSATDVYALGVTMMELILGRNPFLQRNLAETLRLQLGSTPRRLDALLPGCVPEELGELVHRMIAKTPAHRPRAETCAEALAGIARSMERAVRAPTARLA